GAPAKPASWGGQGRAGWGPYAWAPAALRDLLVVLFDQAQLAARLEVEVPCEEARDPLDVELAVGEVGARVRRPLHNPALARAPVGVVEEPGVLDRGGLVRRAVDEEQRAGLETAQDPHRAGVTE